MLYDAYNTDSAIWIFILLGAAAFVYKAFKEDGFGAALSALLRVIAVLFGAALLIMLGVTFIGIANSLLRNNDASSNNVIATSLLSSNFQNVCNLLVIVVPFAAYFSS